MTNLMSTVRPITAVAAAIFAIVSYAAGRGTLPGAGQNDGELERRDQVIVFNVDQLYAAVNDTQNAGRQVVAAPGTYMLSAIDSSGVPRPNGGRLELQEDMSLVGVIGDRDAVVINAINMPSSSLTGGPIPLAPIRLGRGRNSVEWLTLRDAKFGLGNIVNGLTYSGTPHIRIAHIASTGAAYGVSFFNFGPAFSGKTLELDIVDNDLFEAAVGLRTGFRIGNFAGATGAVVNARLIGNRMWGNQFSLIVNNGAVNSTINVESAGNRYFNNGNGLAILGGFNANGNTINFRGTGDHYLDNTAGSNFDRGGLVIVGGENTSGPGLPNNNTVTVSLFGCRFSGNDLWDLGAIGARSFPETLGDPGTNNHVTVNLVGIPRRPDFVEFFADSVPFDAATTNSVTVNR